MEFLIYLLTEDGEIYYKTMEPEDTIDYKFVLSDKIKIEKDLAKEYDTQVLGNVPIEPTIRVAGDEGKPVVYHYPESATAKRYLLAAEKLWESVEASDADNSGIQPTTPPGVSACSA